MLFWTALFGAILGFFVAGFEGYGIVIGGFFGFIGGWGLRRAIRAEIAAAIQANTASKADPLWTTRIDIAPEVPLSKSEVQPAPVDDPIVTNYRSIAAEEPITQQAPEPEPLTREQASPPVQPNTSASPTSDVFSAARNWLFGGNTIVRVGLVVLFIGLSFLASYAAAAGLFPVEMRLALVAVFGAGLLIFGFRTRLQRPNFGLALQGGGVATIYMTLFAAARLVEGFPLVAAFTLMLVVCALGCALALLQSSQALAVTAFAGGIAVPLLLSTGRGDVNVLFSYYTLLNVAILFIAHQRSWRFVNLVGFVSTFGVLSLLVAGGYEPRQFMAFQIFLIASVLIYVATSVFYARNTLIVVAGQLANAVDVTLLFGTALVGFGLEASLIGDHSLTTAFAALAFAALYIGVAAVVARRLPNTNSVMIESMLAIGIGFVTLAVPLAFGARWTSVMWALEGAGAFWVGMRQARWLPRLFGLVLQSIAALHFVSAMGPNVASLPLANSAFMGAMMIALAILATAWWLRRELPPSGSRFGAMYTQIEGLLAKPAFLLGFAFWWLAWVTETNRMPPLSFTSVTTVMNGGSVSAYGSGLRDLLAMLAFVASAWGFQKLGRAKQWQVAIWPSAASLVALVFGFLSVISSGSHVLYLPGCLVWAVVIGLHVRMLYLNDCDEESPVAKPLLTGVHVGGVWLAIAMLADCMWLAIDKGDLWNTSWAGVGSLACVVGGLLTLTLWATRTMNSEAISLGWPRDRHCLAYGWIAAFPIAVLVAFGALITTVFASGAAGPLPYVPILNPVDLIVAMALATLLLWRRNLALEGPKTGIASHLAGRVGMSLIGALAFVAINTVWLRIAHQLLGVDWAADQLFGSVIVQTGFAILWTVLALPLMVVGHRRAHRSLWLVGAALLGLTVAKLVLVDLNNTGGGARIIAFIGVGVLMLVVGYLAPLPPRLRANEASSQNDASSEGLPL